MKKILLVGNPNTGKTTVFNQITKSNEHVGNWHGVTVDSKSKAFDCLGEKCELTDLPGIYSLTYLSFEEKVATDYLKSNFADIIINVCDINNLNRNLFLTMQLLELNLNVVLLINDMGNKNAKNIINEKLLSSKLNIPVVLFNSKDKKCIEDLKYIIKNYKKPEYNKIKYRNSSKINQIINFIKNDKIFKENKILNEYFCAIKLLENDDEIVSLFGDKLTLNISDDDLEIIIKDKYDYISCVLSSCYKTPKNKVYGKSKLDKIILNKYLALPIFLLIMFGIFYLTFFSLGAFLSNMFKTLIQDILGAKLIELLCSSTNNLILIDFFETGIIGGVGSLMAFLPQVILLFLFLSILEDSGYLARIAFSFDDLFSKVGLSGKSVYTLLMGFGCSTTAALTARNMEDKNSKTKTALLAPYMSCSAKLPIYAVIGGAFFGASNAFVVFMLYFLGVIVALLLSLIFEKTSLKSKKQSFILEFPDYRIISIKRVFNLIKDNIKLFLIRIGTLLISMNVIVWVLQSFSFRFGFVKLTGEVSMLQGIGSVIAPIFAPLGFGNWGAASALLAGLVAKEIVVSSIAMFNGVNAYSSNVNSEIQSSITNAASAVYFTPASAISYMVFCLLYSPCIATLSVFRKELGKKWTYLSILIQLVVAYVCAFVVFNIYSLILNYGFLPVFFYMTFALLLLFSVIYLIRRAKRKKTCSMSCKNCKNCCIKK